ncbi:hypothetical protein JCM14076_26150 [Methylosoma difficile]
MLHIIVFLYEPVKLFLLPIIALLLLSNDADLYAHNHHQLYNIAGYHKQTHTSDRRTGRGSPAILHDNCLVWTARM